MVIDCSDRPRLTTVFVPNEHAILSEAPRPAIFLDRDGVINYDDDYVGTVDHFEFVPGIVEFMKTMQSEGYIFVVVTNQGGPARKKKENGQAINQPNFTEKDYEKLRVHMNRELVKQGVPLEMELACFAHEKADFSEYLEANHPWRKPNPGMILYATEKLNIDLKNSVMIGDKISDVEAGLNANVGLNILFAAGFNRKGTKDCITPDIARSYIQQNKYEGKVVVATTFAEMAEAIRR